MLLQWNKLLCPDTLAAKEKTPSSWVDYPMDPFEQDYREIISSVSFRRLQDKAQVYQFGKGDFVRTRLTHSLEVSTIAKQLGIMMIYNNKWNHIPPFANLPTEYARTIPTVLACAGLLHDMGNPPFGHEGEYILGAWFREQLTRDSFSYFGKPIRDILNDQMKSDLVNFEGNAQVIRMLSKTRFALAEHEANVSYATISTLIKYPVSSVEMNKKDADLRVHKFGYYLSEKELVKDVRLRTGMALENEPYARNPLTYLLEAADDIAYVASDIEDAVDRNTVSLSQFISYMKKNIAALSAEGDEQHQLQAITAEGILNNLILRLDKCEEMGEDAEITAFHAWTNYLRNWLMYVTASSFVSNWEAIMDGSYRGDLLEGSHHKYTVSLMKDVMRKHVYTKIGDIHVAAQSILYDLIGRFIPAVIYWDTEQEMELLAGEYVGIIPEKFKEAYRQEKRGDPAFDLYLRFRMVSDYITSMTDQRALELYKKLNAYSY